MNGFAPISNGQPILSPRAADLIGCALRLNQIKSNLTNDYLCKGWLAPNTAAMVYGGSNTGKTTVTSHLAQCVASGEPFFGHKTKQGFVGYLAAEGGGGIVNRFAALGVEYPELVKHDNFMLIPSQIDLFGSNDATAISEIFPNAALIVVDTLARSMGIGDENSSKDMGQFIANIDRIRELTGATVLVVHHTGKSAEAGARGSSALRAALDTEILITADGEIKCTKQRDLEFPGSIQFELKPVILGKNVEGDDVTSVVVTASTTGPKSKPLRGKAQVAMSALHDALKEHGRVVDGVDYPADAKCVELSIWRHKCTDHGLTTGVSDSAARTAFARNKDKLLELDEVRIFNDLVWCVTRHSDVTE